MIYNTLLACILLGLNHAAYAIVNVSDLHLADYPPGYSGSLAATLSSLSGNSTKQEYELGTSLRWIEGQRSHMLLLDRAYGENQSSAYVDKAFLHWRNIWQRSSAFAWELFLQTEQDRFARLSSRHLIGAGARFTHLFAKQGKLHLGSGLMQEQESLFDVGDTSDGGTLTPTRANLYLVVEYKLRDNLHLVSSTYLQPDLDNHADYRLLEQASLRYTLNRAVSLKLNLNVRTDSTPPQRVKQTDTGLILGLEYSF